MKKERKQISISKLVGNNGQLGWLPKNPRQWTKAEADNMRRSIEEDPDFLDDRPLLVVEGDGKYIVFGGNLRLVGASALKLKQLPCVVHVPESDEDRETVKRRAIKDNGSFGQWDYDTLANEWDDLPLTDWGIPAWETNPSDLRLSTKGREDDEGYDDFVNKFKPKLTTDDCYTPPAVYGAVLNFVRSEWDINGKKIERPFVPGGDYEHYQYQQNSVVIDNPPFSQIAAICRFYSKKGIPFFIFAPQLTLFSATDCDLTYIISHSQVVYENGATVLTSFITNMPCEHRIWCCPELHDALEDAQPKEDKTKDGFIYPDNIVTAAVIGKIPKYATELKIRKSSCLAINNSESAKAQGRALFGGGFILSDRAAADRAAAERAAAERAAAERAAAERAAAERAAAKRAAATRLELSEKEKAIISSLNEKERE